MSLINLSLENYIEDDYLENTSTDLETNELYEEAVALEASTRIQRVMQAKVDRGEELSDEEIFIATETIGRLYSSLGSAAFEGFGFEQYAGKELTQMEKSKIALEAISNQNADKWKTWKAKFERFGHSVRDSFSSLNGSLSSMKSNAEDLLNKVRSADDEVFSVNRVTDKRVSIALNRGYKKEQFKNHKEVLAALAKLNDSVKILASASKYESLNGKEGSSYDLGKLVKDMDGRIINKTDSKATYDLNPENLNGSRFYVTIPDNSDNNWVMRNLKANFVLSTSDDGQGTGNDVAYSETDVRPLNRKECEALLTDVLKHIENEGRVYRTYYNDATTGLMDVLKIVGKSVVFAPIGNLVYMNSLVYRARIDSIAARIQLINRGVLRGLLAWVASSMK